MPRTECADEFRLEASRPVESGLRIAEATRSLRVVEHNA